MKPASDPAGTPVVILGGTGYVSGELLRLLALHPRLHVAAVASTSQAGESVTAAFPHLAGTSAEGLRFSPPGSLAEHFARGAFVGLFAATPQGETAGPVDALLRQAEEAGATLGVVDLSADFRYADPAAWAAVYGRPHGAPGRCASFTCALPEHHAGPTPMLVAHPGCFTTAAVLPLYPLFAAGLCDEQVFVSAVTGSSGSGRTPTPRTHHPERHASFAAYSPLAHRHEPEMRALLAKARPGASPDVEFVPHSGPFVRGIHATVRCTLRKTMTQGALVEALNGFYAGGPFVEASAEPPKLTEVVGTNRCRIGAAVRGRTVVLTSAIDNLVKGAAGGAVQWMNRLAGLADGEGLRLPGLGVL